MRYYHIEGLSCSACAQSAQNILSKHRAVQQVRVNFSTNSVALDSVLNLEQLNEILEKRNFKLFPKSKQHLETIHTQKIKNLSHKKRNLILSLLLILVLYLLQNNLPTEFGIQFIELIISTFILVLLAKEIYSSALKKMLIGEFNMDSLVFMGTFSAYFYSLCLIAVYYCGLMDVAPLDTVFEASNMILLFVNFGKFLEEKALDRTHKAVNQLIMALPDEINLRLDNQIKKIPSSFIQKGDVIQLNTGDQLLFDGMILSGAVEVEKSILTGEQQTVFLTHGDHLISGANIIQGSCTMQVETTGAETYLNKLMKLIEEAQNQKIPLQRLADKIASVFVPSILFLSAIVLMIWYYRIGFDLALTYTIAVLVVACPCALGLATPMAIVNGLSALARNGILMKNTAVLDEMHQVDTYILDKTGTLTETRLGFDAIHWNKHADLDNETMKAILFSMEQQSKHPIANALCAELMDQVERRLDLDQFINHWGKGLSCFYRNEQYFVGNYDLLKAQAKFDWKFSDEAKSYLFFFNKDVLIAQIYIKEEIKAGAAELINHLKKNQKRIILLSGDNRTSVEKIANKLLIDEYHFEKNPEQKLEMIQTLKTSGAKILMLGDGINDAPSLAACDVGVSLQSSSELTLGSADVVIDSQELGTLNLLMKISQRIKKVIHQNLFWALAYNLLLIPLAAGLWHPYHLSPVWAGMAMSLSSLMVVINSMRLMKD